MYSWKSHSIVHADYQHWANEVLFEALDRLKPEALDQGTPALPGSLRQNLLDMHRFLQHWSARLRDMPTNARAATPEPADWRALKTAVRQEIRDLENWLEAQSEEFFDDKIDYTDHAGNHQQVWARDALDHLFSHLAQRRGEAAALAMQLGAPRLAVDFLDYRQAMARCLTEMRVLG
jgi:uncharacterized damage-inducible protein DinB